MSLPSGDLKTPCDSLASLFSAPEAVCPQWGARQLTLPRWPRCACRLVTRVHACVCRLCDLGVSCSSSRAESILTDPKGKEDLRKRQRLSHESGTSWISSSSVSSSQDTPSGGQLASSLGPGWFSVTISG